MDFRFLWETLKVEYLGDDLYKWSVKGVFDGKIGTLEFYSEQKKSNIKTEYEDYYIYYGIDNKKCVPIRQEGFLKINFTPINNELFTLKIDEENK